MRIQLDLISKWGPEWMKDIIVRLILGHVLLNSTYRHILTMKSAQINKYGSSEVIEINQSTPEPSVSLGKVLVDIKAAGVNPVDWKISEGYMQQLVSLQFPSTLGLDFSG